ncbi:MAG: hypothetical protein ACTTJW_00025 [Sphaerochaeta sp.]
MGEVLKKSTGRDVWAMLLDDSTVIKGTGNNKLVSGHLYGIKAKGSDSGLPAGSDVGNVIFGQTGVEVTLKNGDEVIDLGNPFDVENLIGYARSKDITKSKNTVDMSVDGDLSDSADTRVDPTVSISGNINGYKVNGQPATSASRKIDAMFGKQIIQSADGSITTIEKSDKSFYLSNFYNGSFQALNNKLCQRRYCRH